MISMNGDDTAFLLLSQAQELVEIRNADDTVLGYFAPANLHSLRITAVGQAQVDIVTARGDRQKHEVGRTLWQIFERLKTLPADERERADLQRRIDRMIEENRNAEL
jgi:hypothetical protein